MRDRQQGDSGLVEMVQDYLPEVGGTVFCGALYDFMGNLSVDNLLPNLLNGAGTVGGIYFIKNFIEYNNGNNENASEYRRGITKSLVIACAATALTLYFKENANSATDYLFDLFQNTMRYGLGFAVPLLFYLNIDNKENKSNRGKGYDVIQEESEPDERCEDSILPIHLDEKDS
jgi:hypothetical protein